MLQDAFKDSPQATLGLKLLKIGDIGVVAKDLLDKNEKFAIGFASPTSSRTSDGNRCTSTCPGLTPKKLRSILKHRCCRSDHDQEGSQPERPYWMIVLAELST